MTGIDHVIDTNVIIGLLKGHTAAVELARDAGLRLERAAISQITRMELLGYPELTEEEDRAARAFIGACHVIGLDDDVERHAVRIRRAGTRHMVKIDELASLRPQLRGVAWLACARCCLRRP